MRLNHFVFLGFIAGLISQVNGATPSNLEISLVSDGGAVPTLAFVALDTNVEPGKSSRLEKPEKRCESAIVTLLEESAESQYNLGEKYANGDGVARDDTAAVIWYRKSAIQGFPLAQFYLGLMYLGGHGVAQDVEMGFGWVRQAAAKGLLDAIALLAEM
jgi:TPR repeat protein